VPVEWWQQRLATAAPVESDTGRASQA